MAIMWSLMQDGLMMLSFNCRSIRNKVTELTSKLDELDIDICMLQETWLSRGWVGHSWN